MKIYMMGTLLFSSISLSVAAPHDSLLLSVKSIGLDMFIKEMESDFYKINKVESNLIKSESNEEQVKVSIFFDDSHGCKNRESITVCKILDEESLSCVHYLTNCLPEQLN